MLPHNFTIGNAAGTCKTTDDVRQAANSGVDTITVGSISVSSGPGNPGTNHHRNEALTSVNSLGLPNKGLSYYQEHLSEMVRIAHAAGKKLAVSIAPYNRQDFEILLKLCVDTGVDIIEFNAGCPNIWTDGKPKRIITYDPNELFKYMYEFDQACPKGGLVEKRIKISYVPDFVLLSEIASVLANHQVTIVNFNTLANARMFYYLNNKRFEAVEFGKHLGGLSGPELRPLSLGQITLLKELLPAHDIIGVNGITNWQDASEFLAVGAIGIQVGGEIYYQENYRVINSILEECAQTENT